MITKFLRFICSFFILIACSHAYAEKSPLPVDEAFKLSSSIQDSNQFTLNWTIAPEYHLYSDSIQVKVITPHDVKLAKLQLPQGKPGDDISRGSYMEYYDHLAIPVKTTQGSTTNLKISVSYQGCADMGLCYPPQTKTIALNQAAESNFSNLVADSTDANSISNILAHQSLWLVLLSFFIFGLLLSFTPCVFPMLPILSSIIAGHGEHITTRKALTLSVIYVLASAMTYALAGIFAGLAGHHLQSMLQNNWVITISGFLFIILALSLFGFYELRLPHAIQNKLSHFSHEQKTGSLYGVAIMGILSTLVVSPCVSAPLVGALAYIGQTGSAALGGTALFIMGLGMGLPLIIIGASAGKLLPKAGNWMNQVKSVFGVILIAMAIWLWSRIIPAPLALALWGILAITCSIQMGALDAAIPGWPRLCKALGIVLGIYGLCLFVGAASGSDDALLPLAKLTQSHNTDAKADVTANSELNFIKINNLNELNTAIANATAAHIPTMVDFYADWCESCQVMKREVFANMQVKQALQQKKLQLLQVDLTKETTDKQAILKKFHIIAPPSFIFFDTQGKWLTDKSIVGEQSKDSFLTKIP